MKKVKYIKKMNYKEFEILLINKQNELIGEDIHEDIPAKITFDLNSVVSFREAHKDDKQDDLGGATIVYLLNGENFFLNISYKEFKNIIHK